jgi:hypothetical protein
MAVIQISKIQVRRGLQENLPQLASGEFGWSIDQRRLYIGNGTLSEGAPAVGNTEILTSSQDILSAIQSYIFKGDESGYTSLTGPNLLSPVTRSLQHKLDEQISVKDFGAVGDGSTDDTVKIQRAINEIYPSDYFTTTGVRRKLHFPAGVYRITAQLTIPPYAKLCGDGPLSTVIRQESAQPVVQLRDSRGNFGSSMNPSTSILPFQIEVNDLTLSTTAASNVAVIDSATTVMFDRVNFKGNISSPLNPGVTAGVQLLNTKGNVSQVSFTQCQFGNITFGISAYGNVSGVTATDCVFDNLYQGVYTSANIGSPQHVKVTDSTFSNVAKQAIYSGDDSSVISAFNRFRFVGFGDTLGIISSTANTSVISWNTPNNFSIADQFDRDSANVLVKPLIEILGTGNPALGGYTTSGALQTGVGYTKTLAGNTVVANVGLLISSNTTNIIDYSINRLGNVRVGTIQVTQTGGSAVYSDDYSETGIVGVTLNFQGYGTSSALTYATSNTAPVVNGTIKYSLRSFI